MKKINHLITTDPYKFILETLGLIGFMATLYLCTLVFMICAQPTPQ